MGRYNDIETPGRCNPVILGSNVARNISGWTEKGNTNLSATTYSSLGLNYVTAARDALL